MSDYFRFVYVDYAIVCNFPKFRIENVCISEHSVEKQEICSYLKIFRETNYSVNLLLSQLLSRNFCGKWRERITAISTNCMNINLRKQAKMCLDIFHLFTNCIYGQKYVHSEVEPFLKERNFGTLKS